MGLINKLFGGGQMTPLADIKRRAKVGVKITMVSAHIQGSDRSIPDLLIGVPRTIIRVRDEGIMFDKNVVGGEDREFIYWPEVLKMVDQNTFIIEDFWGYYLYRIDG